MIRRVSIGSLGHPLYVNGQLFAQPVTISHVPGAQAGFGDVDPSMGALGAYVGYRYLGADDEVLPGSAPASLAPVPPPAPSSSPTLDKLAVAYKIAGTVAAVAGVYHGYKRNDSVGWALGWGILAGAFPLVTIPIAVAQGFGKRKGGLTPNRSRRRRNSRVTARANIQRAGRTAKERGDNAVDSFNVEHEFKVGDWAQEAGYSRDQAWAIYKSAFDRASIIQERRWR